MLEMIKTNVDRLLLVPKLKKSSILAKYIGECFLIVETKSSLSPSVFMFSVISQILKIKFYVLYFRYKNVETGANCSHKIAAFLKYHMPLNK